MLTNWDGPYKVTEVIMPGTLWLESPKGVPLARPWNSDNLKKFYVQYFSLAIGA